MAAWMLVACLVQLRTEFTDIAPGRDRESDGSIGDTAHADGGSSDHLPDEQFAALRSKDSDRTNEVHAIDVDVDLRTPGLSMEQVVQFILARCRSGAERRLRYIIFNRRIWSASEGWRQQTYTGPNPHDKHAHFSASYDSKLEASTASWHLEDIPVALTSDDRAWLKAEIRDAVNAAFTLGKQKDSTPTSPAGAAVLSQGIPNGMRPGAPRDTAWEVIRDIGSAVRLVGEDLAEVKAAVVKAAPPAGQ